jgi:hypothetical protein
MRLDHLMNGFVVVRTVGTMSDAFSEPIENGNESAWMD